MELIERQKLFAYNTSRLIKYIFDLKNSCIMTTVCCDQDKTSTPPGAIWLELNLYAVDGTLVTDPKTYEVFGAFWEKCNPNNRWGGRYTENKNRFQMNK